MLEAITLVGDVVRLEPLCRNHTEALAQVVQDGELYRLWFTSVPTPDKVADYIDTALQEQQLGKSLPFVIIRQADNQIVGCTRYCHIEARKPRLEIGYTFYRKSVQKTAVNTEAKWLLLRHAFEQMGCIAVEFRTHFFNHESRRAIARLGAKQDGILRNIERDQAGRLRDTVIFSIIQHEWPVVSQHLQFQLTKPRT